MRRENKFKTGRNKLLWGNNGRKCLDSIPHLSSNVFPLFYLSLSFHFSLSLSLGLYLFLSLSLAIPLSASSYLPISLFIAFILSFILCRCVWMSLSPFSSLFITLSVSMSLSISHSLSLAQFLSHSFSSSAQNLQFDLNNIYLNSKMIHQWSDKWHHLFHIVSSGAKEHSGLKLFTWHW